jgi:hypothetical protein
MGKLIQVDIDWQNEGCDDDGYRTIPETHYEGGCVDTTYDVIDYTASKEAGEEVHITFEHRRCEDPKQTLKSIYREFQGWRIVLHHRTLGPTFQEMAWVKVYLDRREQDVPIVQNIINMQKKQPIEYPGEPLKVSRKRQRIVRKQ